MMGIFGFYTFLERRLTYLEHLIRLRFSTVGPFSTRRQTKVSLFTPVVATVAVAPHQNPEVGVSLLTTKTWRREHRNA